MRKDWASYLPHPELAEKIYGKEEEDAIKEIMSLHNRYYLCQQSDVTLDVIDYYNVDVFDLLERVLPLLAHLIGIPPTYYLANGFYAQYYYDEDEPEAFMDDIDSIKYFGVNEEDVEEFKKRMK